ncbi:MAG: HAD-IA family hydrolase [Acidimicrobiia bacterium]|nr:HAD-IA family hydrolase [Acidimicrobiia bacterium]
MSDFKAVLWDFGGVLSSSPFEAFARYEEERGLPHRFLRTVNATDPDTNAWAQLERSEVDLDAFDALFAAESERLGHQVPGRDVLGLLAGDLRTEMVDAVRALRRHGLRTALLTNNVASMHDGDGWSAALRLHELFDVVIESSKAGVRTPDPAAYELVLEALDVAAAEVVFLDDLGVNLKPARAMGMATIKVDDPDVALTELEALVGVPLRRR